MELADVNEGKFVLNIDFIIALLKPDGLCVYEKTIKTDKTAYNFSVSLILDYWFPFLLYWIF
jgi:hypothetical protein